MKPSSCLLLTLASLCCAVEDDIIRFLKGEDVHLDVSSFVDTGEELRTLDDIYASKTYSTSFMGDLNNQLGQLRRRMALSEWAYKTNITDHNRQQLSDVTTHYQKWRLSRIKEAKKFNLKTIPHDLRRQISIFTLSAISTDKRVNQRKIELQGTMEALYSSGRACLRNGSCLAMDPDLTNIMAQSRDPELLKEVWLQWRNGVGPSIKQHYTEFVDMLNVGAIENGYPDYSVFWKQELFYDSREIDGMLRQLWTSVRPLYLQLHAYVRRKLREHYGNEIVGRDGTIPAHLLGNMWAQHWPNIIDIVRPFPEMNLGEEIEVRLKAHVDVPGMFMLAQRFYKSIGFYRMTPTFWKMSMLTKPKEQNVVCQASAHDMYYPGDYRIKMCAEVTYANFRTIHHEMGHIEYFMAYSDQPTIYRDGANAAFHEAVGDTIGLSVMSPTHLQALELVDHHETTWSIDGLDTPEERNVQHKKSTINTLLQMALEKIAFLPFGLLVDTWRWGVMQGNITPETYNRKWWEMRLEYQGIRSPVPRSENDFDPGAKYHVPANSAYISYFVSYIQQFQMYKSLCQGISHSGPLHECDFYGSQAAGNKLRHMMSEGLSVPWQTQLKFLTGSSQVTTEAIMEYFQPLYDWLVLDNSIHREQIGWDKASINWSEE